MGCLWGFGEVSSRSFIHARWGVYNEALKLSQPFGALQTKGIADRRPRRGGHYRTFNSCYGVYVQTSYCWPSGGASGVPRLSRPEPSLMNRTKNSAAVKVFLFCVAVLVACGAPLQAQVNVIGTVVDSAGNPLSAIAVSVAGLERQTLTDEIGQYRLNLPPGTHTIRFQRLGFAPLEVPFDIPSDGRGVHDLGSVRLQRQAVPLEEVEVRAERRELDIPGFGELEQLVRAGFGDVITADDIKKMQPLDVTDILRRVPGLVVTSEVRFSGAGTLRACQAGPTFVIDGLSGTGISFVTSRIVDPLRQIEAVWGYRGAMSSCGVIAIQTRLPEIGEGSPFEIGLRVGGGAASEGIGQRRAGAYMAVPLSERFEFYPALVVFLGDDSGWQLQLAGKFLPRTLPIYLGAGLAVEKLTGTQFNFLEDGLEARPLFLTGVAISLGGFRAYAEVQAVDIIDPGDARIDVLTGVGLRIGR